MSSTKIYSSILSIILLASLYLTGCSTISVNQDYDPGYDFSKLKTFGFLPIPDDAGIDQINATRLSNAIKANLTAKEYTLSDKADFGVAVFFSKKTKTNVQSYGYGYGNWGRPAMYGTRGVDVTQYDEGTLVIDFIDMAENKLVWRGIGTGTLSQTTGVEERTEKINNAVTKILEQFPPTKE
jgi:hypothetical protein